MKTTIKLLLLTGLVVTTAWAGGNRYVYDYDGYGRPYHVKVKKYKGPGKSWRGHGPTSARYYAPRYVVRARPVRPGPGYVWIDPYRDWCGPAYGYVWVPGRWVVPPHPRAVWLDGYWAPRGGTHIWISAHWR